MLSYWKYTSGLNRKDEQVIFLMLKKTFIEDMNSYEEVGSISSFLKDFNKTFCKEKRISRINQYHIVRAKYE